MFFYKEYLNSYMQHSNKYCRIAKPEFVKWLKSMASRTYNRGEFRLHKFSPHNTTLTKLIYEAKYILSISLFSIYSNIYTAHWSLWISNTVLLQTEWCHCLLQSKKLCTHECSFPKSPLQKSFMFWSWLACVRFQVHSN